MRRLLVLSTCLLLLAQHISAVNDEASFTYAFDVLGVITAASLQCLRDSEYKTAFIRGYTTAPDKQHGAPDPDAVTNIQLASAIGLRTEVYMVPQIGTSGQTGAQQLEEMYSHLLDANIIVKSVWIEVTHRSGWSLPFAASRNVDFLNSFLQRANIYGLSVGILTNLDEWNEITGSASINNVMLWYFKTNGTRTFADSPANFDDFVPFAGWTSPTAKRFTLSEKVCGQYSDRDIYSTSSASASGMARREESDRYVVGGLGLGSTALPGRAEIRQ